MIRLSASYGYYNPNFVIQNIDEPKEWAHPAFAILKNLLMRGCPTIPSSLLRDNFGDINKNSKFKYSRSYDDLRWNKVIKGSDKNNPAHEFYTNILSEKIFMGKTFIPEYPVCEIVPTLQQEQVKEDYGQVDFYSPAYNTVIEIDGIQHNDADQSAKDYMRDNIFAANNINVIRLNTQLLKDHKTVEDILQSSLHIDAKTNNYCNDKKAIFDEKEIPYMVAIRIQLLLNYLYGSSVLDIKDNAKISILADFTLNEDIVAVAVNDYYLWLKNILALHNISFELPELDVKIYYKEQDFSRATGLKVDISLRQVYSQPSKDDVYYIRNDYFNFESKRSNKKEKNNCRCCVARNYFHVECVPVEYHVNVDTHADNLRYLLRNTSDCGYEEYRANQLDIIIELLNNRSVIGVLPTGAGKSLCYQIAALLIPSMTIVVSPLQLLMLDQYKHLCGNFGMNNATYINASHTENLSAFEQEKAIVTYVSPERFFNRKFSNYFDKQKGKFKVGFIVIDEAHCLSEWGHDFRTSYLCLSHNLSNILPSNTFVMALTGTASHSVFKDIENELSAFTKTPIRSIFADDMRRENLDVSIKSFSDLSGMFDELTYNLMPTIIGEDNRKTIVFTKTVNNMYNDISSACTSLCYKFRESYPSSNIDYFSGELDEGTKQYILDSFQSDNGIKVLFATKAFGMGIDIKDIRKTIHYGLPSSMESLYQQIGRAGRDNKRSNCYIYFIKEDDDIYNEFFKNNDLSIELICLNRKHLKELGTNFYFLQSSNLDSRTEKNAIWKLNKIIQELNADNVESIDCLTIAQRLACSVKDEHLINVLGGKVVERRAIDPNTNEMCYVRDIILSKLSNSASIIIEKALYRLFLLGEIEMWNVAYSVDVMNPIYIHLRSTKYSDDEKFNMLVAHIEKYESRAKAMPEDKTFLSRLDKLVDWSYNTFFIERIKSMKTLYDWCKDFVDSNNFMKNISNYFSNEPVFIRLVDKAVDIDDIDKALVRKPQETKARIARLLESYENMFALNYVSGITRLRLNEYDEFDGERRLNLSMEYIKDMPENKRRQLFNLTCEYLTPPQVDVFVEAWLRHANMDVYWIYDKTSSEAAEQYLLFDSIDRILRIKEKIDARLQ